MITLKNVNKYFNHHRKNEIHVINDTSLELPDHGLVALLGPSGCGKTTLLNAIGGLDKVNKGKIYVDGKRITHKRAYYKDKVRNLNIGYIFQNYYLIDSKSVYENVALSLKMVGIKNKTEIKKRVNYVLETLGIYRYRNRLASMLSGGERQRVGIARAIVKDPKIIIADEPTGNLDSSNTIETMNIIKSISKTRLVLLVTHETDIARFYADRIVEIEDGKIIKDYENKNNDNLDYRMDNKIYLKDFKYHDTLKTEENEINIYNDHKNDLKLTVVVKNNNIYIKGAKNQKIEVVDNDSNIELINDHYRQIDKSIYEKYEFNFAQHMSTPKKLKYSAILNPFTSIIAGFKKILDYSFIKKILLLGFFASSAFITYCVCNIFGILNIKDSYFINKNHNYYDVTLSNIKVDNFLAYESFASIDYLLPGDGKVNFIVKYPEYYQTMDATSALSGSLTSLDYVKEEDLIYGHMPANNKEIVVDKMALEKMKKNNETSVMVGYKDVESFIGTKVYLTNNDAYTIVGIVDKEDPSIYAHKDEFITLLYYKGNEEEHGYQVDTSQGQQLLYKDYKLNDVKIKEGRLPENNYEVVINYNERYAYPIGKSVPNKINDQKLVVVGYFENPNDMSLYVNGNMIKYDLINKSSNIVVMPKDEKQATTDFNNENLNIISSYDKALNEYKLERKDSVKAALVVSGVILLISFIEIYLMIRASFLSRIKEVGIYRAIGVKKTDIYKMFYGEIFVITTLMCVPACLFTAYVLKSLDVVSYFAQNYLVNFYTIILSILIMYIFNLIVGLLPVFGVVRKTPAQILARKDID